MLEKNYTINNWLMMVVLSILGSIAALVTLFFSGGGHGLVALLYIFFPLVAFLSMIVLVIMSLLQCQGYSTVAFAILMFCQYPLYGTYLIKYNKKGELKKAGFRLIALHLLASVIVFIFSSL